MTHHQLNLIGWTPFVIIAISVRIASIGGFEAMFGAILVLIVFLVLMIPYSRSET